MLYYDRIDVSEGIDINKVRKRMKNVLLFTTDIF